MTDKPDSALKAEALELLAQAHEPRRYLVAVDLRSGNIGSQGVAWIETKAALAAIVAALTRTPPRIASDEMGERLAGALQALLTEFDKFSRYGSPITQAANEARRGAVSALAAIKETKA